MRRVVTIAIGAVLVFLAVAQLFPVDRDNPPIAADLAAPPAIKGLLRSSCYNCHSNETRWPAYARVAPVSWLVASDVHQGRRELNFSDWGLLASRRQRKELQESRKEILDGDMPPLLYRVLHPEARMSAQQRQRVLEWLETAEDELGHPAAALGLSPSST
jgi:hypothetical protein